MNVETTEQIMSRQYAEFKFRNGKVEYFSISTQHDNAKTVEEAISNIIEADKKYEGKSPLGYRLAKDEYKISDPIQEIIDKLKENGII
jgi:hypothetical protein